jgi:hypothetical protein
VTERRRKAEAQVRQARVMLIDDEESNLTSYRRILEPVIDLNRSGKLRCRYEHDTEVVPE